MRIGNTDIHTDVYGGSDTYSDGPIEEELLEIVKEHRDPMEVLRYDHRWPIVYHLHPSRENLLAWYDFRGDEDVLEIGAGCGALTGLLARKCRSVTCCDVSMLRSQINAYKNIDFDNIDICAGNYADLALHQKFDIVTLIGVLEYARLYFPVENENPYEAFLRSVREQLKEDGILMLAIENKFGLKYWAGAREDHTAYLHDSLEGYPTTDGLRTFGRTELEDILRRSGFSYQRFYYPYPDYKFTQEIFSDDWLPRPGELASPPNYDLERVAYFEENRVMDEIIRAGQFPFFANSFLVFAKA